MKEYVLLINEEKGRQLAPLLSSLGIVLLEVQGMQAADDAKYKFVVTPIEQKPAVENTDG